MSPSSANTRLGKSFLGLMALACWTAAVAGHAAAEPARTLPSQPEGWTLQAHDDAVILSSPPTAANEIVLFVIDKAVAMPPKPATPQAASPIVLTAQHFATLTQAQATRMGTLTWRQGVTLEDTLFRDALTIEDPDGQTLHGYAFAYVTPQGLQTLSIYWPNPLTSAAPPVAQALDHVAALWRIRYAFDGAVPTIAPLPAAPLTPPVTASNTP